MTPPAQSPRRSSWLDAVSLKCRYSAAQWSYDKCDLETLRCPPSSKRTPGDQTVIETAGILTFEELKPSEDLTGKAAVMRPADIFGSIRKFELACYPLRVSYRLVVRPLASQPGRVTAPPARSASAGFIERFREECAPPNRGQDARAL
jgi:hypothetical protein